jgi:hypothetical protein
MRVEKTTYGGTKTILYNVDGMEAMPVTVSDAGVAADARGRKVVKAGAFVGAGTLIDSGGGVFVPNGDSALLDKTLPVKGNNNACCEGVLLYDVDVTDGPNPGSMVYKGNIKLGSIPEPPTDEAAAKLPMARFLA